MTTATQRDRDLLHLHPAFRTKVLALHKQLAAEGLPFQIFEGFRAPQRQQYLFDQGRTRPGPVVTHARPWSSAHQYGLAADFVLFENDRWSWDTAGKRQRWWQRLHALGREQGLEPLTFEMPHLQLAGIDLGRLKTGGYPPGGDLAWAEWLEGQVYGWSGNPAAPPVPEDTLTDRPGLPEPGLPPPPTGALIFPPPSGWHDRFGGRAWRHDEAGVYTRDAADPASPLRTPGEPATCHRIWSLYGHDLLAVSRRHGVPVALVMMVIATETAFARSTNFTGPRTFRWEPAVKVDDVTPALWGDYSAGPMQTLGTTARWVIRQLVLDYDPFVAAPVFDHQPEPPREFKLYEPAVSIDIGTATLKLRMPGSGGDPILAAASYNAGGVYRSSLNPWHLKSYGDHLDRAARWYGDACAVLSEAGA